MCPNDPRGWRTKAVPAHGCWLCDNRAVALRGVARLLLYCIFRHNLAVTDQNRRSVRLHKHSSMNSQAWKWNRGGAYRFSSGSILMGLLHSCVYTAEKTIIGLSANSNYCPRYYQYVLIRWPELQEQPFSCAGNCSSGSQLETQVKLKATTLRAKVIYAVRMYRAS